MSLRCNSFAADDLCNMYVRFKPFRCRHPRVRRSTPDSFCVEQVTRGMPAGQQSSTAAGGSPSRRVVRTNCRLDCKNDVDDVATRDAVITSLEKLHISYIANRPPLDCAAILNAPCMTSVKPYAATDDDDAAAAAGGVARSASAASSRTVVVPTPSSPIGMTSPRASSSYAMTGPTPRLSTAGAPITSSAASVRMSVRLNESPPLAPPASEPMLAVRWPWPTHASMVPSLHELFNMYLPDQFASATAAGSQLPEAKNPLPSVKSTVEPA